MHYSILLLACFVFLCRSSWGKEIVVTTTITDAINNSTDGDIIILPSGSYVESLSLFGRNLSFVSETGNFNDVIMLCNNTSVAGTNMTSSVVMIAGVPNSAINTFLSFSAITFSECSNPYGWGGAFFLNASNTTGNYAVNILNCQFTLNQAQKGGALYANGNTGNTTVNIVNSTFISNHAINGGAIYAENGVYFFITESSFLYNYALYGGAAQFDSWANLVISNSHLNHNYATRKAGAFYFTYDSQMDMDNTTLTNNTSPDTGGALNIDTSIAWISNSLFQHNRAMHGGAIFANSLYGTVIISTSTFIHNNASSNGGAVCGSSRARTSLTNSKITQNYAYSGGAIALLAASVYLNSVELFYNSAQQGGDFYLQDSSTLNIQSSLISNSSAWRNGDVIYCQNSNVIVNSTTIVNSNVHNHTDEQNGVFCNAVPAYTWCDITSVNSGNWSNVCEEPTIVVILVGLATWKVVLIVIASVIGALMVGFIVAYLISKKFHAPSFFHPLSHGKEENEAGN